MVEQQLLKRGIRDDRVLEIMARLDRREFVPRDWREQAFEDAPLPTRHGQTISQPYIVAAMTELLDVRDSHRVLEIGTGSGYQAAILAELAREVVTVERHADLAEEARRRLEALGYANVEVVAASGFHGWPARAPYDRILVTAAAAHVSSELVKQLAPCGILIAPEGQSSPFPGDRTHQVLRRWKRTNGSVEVDDIFDVRFVPLVE